MGAHDFEDSKRKHWNRLNHPTDERRFQEHPSTDRDVRFHPCLQFNIRRYNLKYKIPDSPSLWVTRNKQPL